MFINEPIAIVGIALRFPGDIHTIDSLWSALKTGEDLITVIPAERWATNELQHPRLKEPGRSINFSAGVLSRIDEFDAEFFGISPREAAWMDPQQRLLLELTWEALENAGQKPSTLAGSNCAVYVGISSLDYGVRGFDDLASITSHFMTGNTLSIAANRLSYVFDLHGPSASIDTACSSSLVALHHACNSLRTGEASTALVGGVSLLMHPYPFIGFTKASMLSEFGRCNAFDAAGAGYVRSEGGAVLMLKPLKKAQADGDRIRAVILGSGVNADGARKTSMTIPSSQGQQELMRDVLRRSGITPDEIDYIEAHGTGTPVGDPIETSAIGAVYGLARRESLPIGSVKTNLGHMEAASGMAGLIKAILTLEHRAIAPTIHCQQLNPAIDFERLCLDVVRELRPIQKSKSAPVIVGVNSFGFGGANAHVLLQSPPHFDRQVRESGQTQGELPPLFLSTRSANALKKLASDYADLIEHTNPDDYYHIAYSAIATRDRLSHRLAVKAPTPSLVGQKLRAIAAGDEPDGVAQVEALAKPGTVGLVFSGNGSQWLGMGRRLLQESPGLAKRFAKLDQLMRESIGFSILEQLSSDHPDAVADTCIAQPLLFAIQVCIADYLKEQGITPAFACGHSVGEVAAAYACGALTLDEAICVISARSKAQGLTRGSGRMAAVGLSAQDIAAVIADSGSRAAIAGINSPHNVTLSGDLADLELVETVLKPRGVFFRLLDLEYAFHSRHMDAIRDPLLSGLGKLPAQTTNGVKFISTVTGELIPGEQLGASYWWDNIRQPVQFEKALQTMIDAGCRVFLEIGPRAILQRYLTETLEHAQVEGRAIPSLRQTADGIEQLAKSVLQVQLLADTFDPSFYFPFPGTQVPLPNYPWQKERHWHPTTVESLGMLSRSRIHPLLGWRLNEADFLWENTLDPSILPWLSDHQVGGAIVFPGAGFVEMALAAAHAWLGHASLAIEELDILFPLTFDQDSARQIRFELQPRDGTFLIRSRVRLSEGGWVLHAHGRIIQSSKAPIPFARNAQHKAIRTISQMAHYRLTDLLGLAYGPVFRGIRQVSLGATNLLIEVQPHLMPDDKRYYLPPAVFDLCFQSLIDFFERPILAGEGLAFLPVKVGKLSVYSQNPVCTIRGFLRKHSRRSLLADFELLDALGTVVAQARDCRLRAAPLQSSSSKEINYWSQRLTLLPARDQKLAPPWMPIDDWAKHLNAAWKIQDTPRTEEQWQTQEYPLIEALTLSCLYEAIEVVFSQIQDPLERSQLLCSRSFNCWAMHTLREQGLLREQDGQWDLVRDPQLPNSAAIWRTLFNELPAVLPRILLLARIGGELPSILMGQMDPKAVKNKITHLSIAKAALEELPDYQKTNRALRLALDEIAQQLPTHRTLRVLEISLAPSPLGEHLLNALPSDRLAYCLAVPDEASADQMRLTFEAHRNASVIAFDITQWSIQDEGVSPSIYDVIVFRHALHRAPNPRAAIAQAHAMLAQGGLLLVAEHGPSWTEDLIGGLDPAWWRTAGSEVLVPRSSLALAVDWQEALKEVGLIGAQAILNSASQSSDARSTILIAQKRIDPSLDINLDPRKSLRWILVADDAALEFANGLALQLKQAQQDVKIELISSDLTHLASADRLMILLGWGASATQASETVSQVLRLLQSVVIRVEKPPSVIAITRGGCLVDEITPLQKAYHPNPTNAAIAGMIRVAMNEMPAVRARLIDVDEQLDVQQAVSMVFEEIQKDDQFNEILLRESGDYVPTIEPITPDRPEQDRQQTHYRLEFIAPGQLRNLAWFSQPPKVLAVDELEIQTRAVGLNFRDVMYTMGLLADEAVENGFAGSSLGLEFTGVVTRVGIAIKKFHPGQTVMGFGAACFSSHVVTKADYITKMPKDWTFEAAATVPTAFFTAYYALQQLAGLQAGERVLIHGAAGGVGIAAIQIAQHMGLEIYATAGTAEKRDFVRLLGVKHIYDSRTLDFADQILADTQGEGVDVVLNSLAGEAIRRNLRILKPFGRFLELGKRDFFENTSIGLRPFKDNITYYGIDADQLFIARPALATQLFKEVMALFEEGILYPLPYRKFESHQVVDAFRAMQQSRHLGKIVIGMDEPPKLAQLPHKVLPIGLAKASTWIVTGGVSGFGLSSAQWLASRGVGRLVLIGRQGMQTPGVDEAIQTITALGAMVDVFACDVTDSQAITNLISKIADSSQQHPIKGILHAAAQFDDGLIADLNPTRIEAVIAPKLIGAWNLHEASLALDLDYFVVYSSITTMIGNPAQANYVAANAGLEALVRLRRSQSRPALAIAWGPISDAGYLSRNPAIKDSLAQRLGKPPLTASQALDQLDWLLKSTQTGVTVGNFDWPTLARLLPSSVSPRFAVLNQTLLNAGGEHFAQDLRALIRDKSPTEIERIVSQFLAHEIARILCTTPERIAPSKSLHDLGMDSLMAVELSLGLERELGVQLPAMALNDSPTIQGLSARLTKLVVGDNEGEAPDSTRAVVANAQLLIQEHGEELSADELQKLGLTSKDTTA